MGMKIDLGLPSKDGMTGKEFKAKYNMTKSEAKKTFKRSVKGMNKGGLPKKSFAKPGSYSKRK